LNKNAAPRCPSIESPIEKFGFGEIMTALRWLSFIPLAFAASMLAGAVGYWFVEFSAVRFFGLEESGRAIAWIGSGLGSGLAFIFVGMKIAPLRNNKVKWTLVTIVMAFGTISAVGEFFGGDNKVAALAGVVMVFTGISAARMPVEEFIALMHINWGILPVKKSKTNDL
jgi:hypothetical protein